LNPSKSNPNGPHILLVNPWIHDFAAYDYWAKPIGLLTLAAILSRHGCQVSYLDCLNRFHPRTTCIDSKKRMGRGPYLKTPIAKPQGLEDIQRTYSRYGILPEWFLMDLKALKKPDLVLVTSIMTYWYPGVKETIAHIRKVFCEVPIVLGGIYATLWPDHARNVSGADEVICGPAEAGILKLVKEYTGFSAALQFDPLNLDDFPYPAYHLERGLAHVPLLTTRGCPFRCSYCASTYLQPRQMARSPFNVIDEIRFWHKKHGVIDFAFYDDALLIESERHAIPLFEGILKSGISVRFHTPNAVHVREITAKVARLMYRIGIHTLRLGLETTAFKDRNGLDSKVSAPEFAEAVRHLKNAGFDSGRVGAYLLIGLPGQSEEAIEDSIRIVKANNIRPVLAQYTPVPHTALWDQAVAASRYDLNADPIFSNNAIFPCQAQDFSWDLITRLKQLIEA
jgi:radical SAM superfamily enzyme YgiQ (UPF0313 family)